MKNAARFLVSAGLIGSALFVTSCGGSSSGGGGMYVESCTLGCTNGIGGAQVSCGIVNTYQNQDVAVVFSERVSLPSLLVNNAFQVIDTVTGSVPPGTRLVDPSNPNRAIFRPRLAFDAQGNTLYGFVAGSIYQIRVPGTKQADIGPFVESEGGQQNTSRMLCTIITDQGLVDPVPGNPQVSIYVHVVGQPTPANIDTDAPVSDVASNSPITFVFNDLMNIGTIVQPSTGQAPFITIKVDPDGNLSTTADQVVVGGTYTFNVSQNNLTTTVVFTPSGGLPSAGSGPVKRQIVVDVPTNVKDLAGNSVANAGKRTFEPEVINFGTVTVPEGGEQFLDQSRMDLPRTGASWGETTAGRLEAGTGGGSGRLGDLVVPAGATRTLYTSPVKAEMRIVFQANPKIADAAELTFNNGNQAAIGQLRHVYFKKTPTDPLTHAKIEDFLADTLSELQNFLTANPAADPEIAKCTYSIEDGTPIGGATLTTSTANTFVIRYATNSAAGDSFIVSCYPEQLYQIQAADAALILNAGQKPAADTDPPVDQADYVTPLYPYRRATLNNFLAGTVLTDNTSIANALIVDKKQFLTNLAGGSPIPDAVIDDGLFEFNSISLLPNAVLNIVGSNPVRLLARGRLQMADTATINISGADAAPHGSDATLGELGSLGGPGGGRGGQGADRPDNTGMTNLLNLANGGTAANPIINRGVTNVGAVPNGRNGEGIGGALGFGSPAVTGLGSGIGGVQWPNGVPPAGPPTDTTAFNGMDSNTACDSEQLGGAGSGGAFSTDGGAGVPISNNPLGIRGTSNVPPNTPGATAAGVGLPPAAPNTPRALTPSLGYLRGGSGGGGAGSHIFGTGTTGTASACFTAGKVIDVFRSHSGASGGGGGGAIQLVAGRTMELDGKVDATGGNGGSLLAGTAPVYGIHAQPGGGGSGGAILLQSNTIDITPLPNRFLIYGGVGGNGPLFGANRSTGGTGGVGLCRIEGNNTPPLAASTLALSVTPTDALDPNSATWLSVDTWPVQTTAIEGSSGAQSCWMKAPGNFFSLLFNDDTGGTPGWDMDILLNQGAAGTNWVSYRESTVFGGSSPESYWGSLIDDGTLGGGQSSAPIIVRFQGAKSLGAIADPCNANTLTEITGMTAWVMHPSELNSFNPAPDLIRFQIVFDRAHPDIGLIEGVTNVHVHATPD